MHNITIEFDKCQCLKAIYLQLFFVFFNKISAEGIFHDRQIHFCYYFTLIYLCRDRRKDGIAFLCGTERSCGAVELVISLTGMMCLWCGILEVLRDAGAVRKLSKLLSPFMRFAFPSVHGKKTEETVCAAIAANILGIGNAATPLAVRAMNELDLMNPEPTRLRRISYAVFCLKKKQVPTRLLYTTPTPRHT